MSKILIVLSCLVIGLSELMSQITFSKTYNLEENVWVRGREVDLYGEHLYVLTGKVCSNPERDCGDIVKMDFDGNIIWKKEIGAFDIGNTNAVWIHNDTITITGHKNIVEQPFGFFVQQINIEGDSLTNYEFPIDTTLVRNAINYGSYSSNGKIYLYGAGNGHDGSVDAILMEVSRNGELINSVIWDDNFKEVQCADLQLRKNGSLIMLVETTDFGEIDSKRNVISIDESLNREYLWSSPVAADLGVPNNLQCLPNNGYAVLAPNIELVLSSKSPFIYSIDDEELEQYLYQFNYEFGVDLRRYTSNLILAESGEIIGVGYYRGVMKKDVGYIIKLNKEFELVWETTFRSQDWNIDEQRVNDLNDIVELEDGSLVAVGWYEETTDPQSPRDLWVIRVGPDGCLYEEDCGFNQFTTSTIDEDFDTNETWVFPNPASNMLYIDSDIEFDNFKIIQLDGRIVMDGEFQPSIDVSNLDRGMYVIQFIEHGKIQSTRKFIKH